MSFDRSEKNLSRYALGSTVLHTWLAKGTSEEHVWEGTVTKYSPDLQCLFVSYDASYDVDSPEGEKRELEGRIPLQPAIGTVLPTRQVARDTRQTTRDSATK